MATFPFATGKPSRAEQQTFQRWRDERKQAADARRRSAAGRSPPAAAASRDGRATPAASHPPRKRYGGSNPFLQAGYDDVGHAGAALRDADTSRDTASTAVDASCASSVAFSSGRDDDRRRSPGQARRSRGPAPPPKKRASPRSVADPAAAPRDRPSDEGSVLSGAEDSFVAAPDRSGDDAPSSDEEYGVDDALDTLQRALFKAAPLGKFHDFVAGGLRALHGGCAENALALIDRCDCDCEDDEEEATLGTWDDGHKEEEATLDEEGTKEGSDDDSASADHAAPIARYRDTKKRHGEAKKKPAPSRPRSRRGRSPTGRCGHNSDGESIRRHNSHSRSRGSPGLSLSRSRGGRAASPGGAPPGPDAPDARKWAAEGVLSRDRAAWRAMTRPPVALAASPAVLGEVDEGGVGDRRGRGGKARDEARDGADARGQCNAGGENPSVGSGEAVLLGDGAGASPPRDASAVECYFQKLISVGIRLHLHDPHNASFAAYSTLRRSRSGTLYLRFGTRSPDNGRFARPRLLWTDGHGPSHALDLLDVRSVRRPAPRELEERYPSANPRHAFVVTAHADAREGGAASSLLFEAADEAQGVRVAAALRGVVGTLARQIVRGESAWTARLMAAASSPSCGGGGDEGEGAAADDGRVLCAMTDVTDHLVKRTDRVKRTGLMREAQERLRKGRCKGRIL